MVRAAAHLAVVAVLTAITQLGGLAWLIALAIRGRLRFAGAAGVLALFVVVYAGLSLGARQLSPLTGRTPLPCGLQAPDRVARVSWFYCTLNRNYVDPKLKVAADALAAHMNARYPGTVTYALDGSFPFLDGFPLLPHLSHDDGRKLDLAFYYRDENGTPSNALASPIGYFAFEQPAPGDPEPCAGRNDILTLRWDLDFLQQYRRPVRLDEARTREAIRWLAEEGEAYGVEKIFVQPHLQARLGLQHDRIRFQGCRAARHDDHIHFQLR